MNPYIQTFPTQVVYQQEVYPNQMYVPSGYTTAVRYGFNIIRQTPQIANNQVPFTGQLNQVQYQPMYGYGYPTNGAISSGNAHQSGNQ